MTWVDARLDFFNIKLKETMNVISMAELNRIWLPIIIFHNTEEGQTTINDDKATETEKAKNKQFSQVEAKKSTKGGFPNRKIIRICSQIEF